MARDSLASFVPAPVERALALAGHSVSYLLIRKRGRRGVSLRVDHRGLAVSASLSMPVQDIEKMIADNHKWVLKKIAEWGPRKIPEVRWQNAERIPYQGRDVVLEIVRASGASYAELVADSLRIALTNTDPAHVAKKVVAWYRREALTHLAQRAFLFSKLHGLTPPQVFISNALGRWGSCNSRHEVRLAWRLMKARPEVIDYVVCHELAHLRHMNHSRSFWLEVENMCQDYRALRDELEAKDHLYRAF